MSDFVSTLNLSNFHVNTGLIQLLSKAETDFLLKGEEVYHSYTDIGILPSIAVGAMSIYALTGAVGNVIWGFYQKNFRNDCWRRG